MLKSTLLDIIRTFSSEELNKFEDFLRSPYFNKKDVLVSLFLEIKKYSPAFVNEDLERERVWEKLFPGKKFNYGIMKNMIYDLVKLAERFIATEFNNQNELRLFLDLTGEMDDRKIDKILSTRLLSFEKYYNLSKANKSNVSLQDYYLILSKIYWQKIFNETRDSKSSGFTKERNIASEYFIYSFFIYLFKVYDNLRVLKIHGNDPGGSNIIDLFIELIGSGGMDKILDYAKAHSGNDYKLLNCYYAMYKSVSSVENPDFYFNFKSSLSEISNLLNENDLRDLYINLTNSIMNLESLEINREKEFQDIYNMMISNNIFTERNGVLSDNIFNNYILIQSGFNDHSGIEIFIGKYLDRLPHDKRENCYNFGMAHVSFIKGDFSKSLEYILKINFLYFDMKYYVKNLQMMNYFELNDYEAFILAFDSYKHFTSKNKKVHELWKIKTSAFYNTVKTLFLLRNNFDEFTFLQLKKEITGSLPSRKIWLVSKLDGLLVNS